MSRVVTPDVYSSISKHPDDIKDYESCLEYSREIFNMIDTNQDGFVTRCENAQHCYRAGGTKEECFEDAIPLEWKWLELNC